MLPPSVVLQCFFIFAATITFTFSCSTVLNSHFVSYGSRAAVNGPASGNKRLPKQKTKESNFFSSILEWLASLQVPHSYFLHFYVVSVCSSAFWLVQFLMRGNLLHSICEADADQSPQISMSQDQVLVMWILMTTQGLRRLLESTLLIKSSSSTMWFVHWLLGIAFYLGMGVAVWVEGSPMLLKESTNLLSTAISAPKLTTMLGVPIFLVASGLQYDSHNYLARLPKYTLPEHPLFQTFICPHYAAECLIYLSMAIIGAPQGAWLNRTIFSAFIFVATNLSVTAADSKRWYEAKFGKERVALRCIMIPGIW